MADPVPGPSVSETVVSGLSESDPVSVSESISGVTVSESFESVNDIRGIESTVLATADEHRTLNLDSIDDAEALLTLITEGKIDRSICPSTSSLVTFDPVVEPSTSTESEMLDVSNVSWNSELDKIFALEKPEQPKAQTKKSKQITSHRLLTSDEIYNHKKREKEEKEKQELEKQERKVMREQRKLQKKKEREEKEKENIVQCKKRKTVGKTK